MRDFERASINSFMICNPNIPLTDSFFQLQPIYGAINLYDVFPFRIFQEDNFIRAYGALEEHICIKLVEQHFRELLNYYEDSFIGKHKRASWSPTLFPIRLINQCERME
ncbi:hypothetical protein HZS_712 [Henneguya salminicola]|nr:hypothetical protein HZS_712 [Henneguya salminicola]